MAEEVKATSGMREFKVICSAAQQQVGGWHFLRGRGGQTGTVCLQCRARWNESATAPYPTHPAAQEAGREDRDVPVEVEQKRLNRHQEPTISETGNSFGLSLSEGHTATGRAKQTKRARSGRSAKGHKVAS